MQYRGKSSEKYASDIKRTGVPVKIVFTLRKLKTVTPSLKPPMKRLLEAKLYTNLPVHAVKRAMWGLHLDIYKLGSKSIFRGKRGLYTNI